MGGAQVELNLRGFGSDQAGALLRPASVDDRPNFQRARTVAVRAPALKELYQLYTMLSRGQKGFLARRMGKRLGGENWAAAGD